MSESRQNPLEDALNELLQKANRQPVSFETVLKTLEGRGQAALLIIFSLPFCLPVQIPGFSTPFGLMIVLIGLRIAFGNMILLPRFILNKQISYRVLEKAANITRKFIHKLRYFVAPRLEWLVRTPLLYRIHGITISILGLFLALPLPIPFSNLVAAVPLLAFGLAILEDDGYFLIAAYFLLYICVAFFTLLFILGKHLLFIL